jgi:hypothetical protein
MRVVGAITNSSGYPYQWVRRADYAARDGETGHYFTLGNPITMRVVNNRELYEFTQLSISMLQRGMRPTNILYPYDFSDRERYQRRREQRAPYGL